MRVVEGRQHLGFAPKPGDPLHIGCQRRRQDLDRDLALQPGVARPEDVAHAAVADVARDLVGAEGRAGTEGQAAEA